MLYIWLNEGEAFQIGDALVLNVQRSGNCIRVGVDAPLSVLVHRENGMDEATQERLEFVKSRCTYLNT